MRVPAKPTQDEIRRAFELIGPIALGRLVSGRDVGTSETAIAHGLGRVPLGWIEVSRGLNPARESAPPDEKYLYLLSGATITPKLWVF